MLLAVALQDIQGDKEKKEKKEKRGQL